MSFVILRSASPKDLLLLCLAATLMAACSETRSAPNVVPVVARDSTEIQLVVSDTAPAVGDEVQVTASLRATGDSAVAASFTARLLFDSTALRYVGDVSPGDGAMRASNGGASELRVAAAAMNGFTSGVLFGARFRVVQRGGLESLLLTIDELHDARARDLRPSVRVARGFVGAR